MVDGKGMAPEAEAHLRTMAWWNKMSPTDAEAFKKEMDFFRGKETAANWRWIASIPHNVVSALLHLHPNFLADKKEFRRWLKTEGQQYIVPGAKL